ncbi:MULTISPECIES: DUF4352 domain-containing protein [unclassified Paenibacillus]|uniref:DUF4352 domain-containing protein n=1 Tax=unclassified Paenibacillus TaxID=185978 RepID=UPI0036316699
MVIIELIIKVIFLFSSIISFFLALIFLIIGKKVFKKLFFASGVSFYYFLIAWIVVPYVPPFGSMSSESSAAASKATVESFGTALYENIVKSDSEKKMNDTDEEAKKLANKTEFEMGEPIIVKDKKVTINSFILDPAGPDKKFEFVRVTITIENIGNKNLSYTHKDFEMAEPYKTPSKSKYYSPSLSIKPGESFTDEVSFLQTKIENRQIKYIPDYKGKTYIIHLK